MAKVEGADGRLLPRAKACLISQIDFRQPLHQGIVANRLSPRKGPSSQWRKAVKKVRLLIIVAVVATLALSSIESIHAQAKKLKAVATTTIIQDIAKNVAGDKLDVDFLVPTDGDVHAFEPKPEDVKKIADADLILVNGVGLEQFLDKLIADSGTKGKVITVSQGLGIQKFLSIEASADSSSTAADTVKILGISGSYKCGAPQPGEDIGECDPHMWQNVANVIVYTLNIRDAFIAADPANADAYNTNAGNYIVKLQQLDADLFTALASIPPANRVFVTNHDAMGYFATRYGFQIAGVVLPGGTTGQEPDPKAVAALIDTIKAKHVKAVFLENVASDKLAQQIADQSGVKVVQALYTDSLGDANSSGATYLDMIRANMKTLQEALN
jgi:zinc/manganese transport system substrate-binding protein